MENTAENTIGFTHFVELINELRLAGAEAISINDQRIVAMTDVVNPLNFILINGERVTSPFTIKAIGDTTHLKSALSIKGGYIDIYGKSFNLTLETGNVTINKFEGKMTLNYVKE